MEGQADSAPATERQGAPYSALQLLFLLRLGFLLQRRRQYQKLVDGDDWRLKLLNKSIYSTYLDCVSLGNELEAKSLFSAPYVEVQ